MTAPRFWYFTDSVEAQIQWRSIAFAMGFFNPWFSPLLPFVLVLVESQSLRGDCGSFKQCIDIKECPEWSSRLKEGLTVSQRNELNKAICGFQVKEPKVCCMSQDIGNRSVNKPVDLEESDEYSCGVVYATAVRVADGEDSPGPGAWPWMARLIYKENSIRPTATFCGGALVTRRHVLTAAHCARTEGLGEPVEVVLGEHDLTSEYDCLVTADECGGNGTEGQQCYERVECADREKTYKVKEVTLAPGYNSEGGGVKPRTFAINDVAVIKLIEDVLLTNLIQPICLPNPGEDDGARMALAGWGNIAEGPKPIESAVILQELNQLIEIPLRDSDAEDGFGCKTLLDLNLKESQMCISREEDMKGNSCRGDSGGPVSRLRRNDRGEWETHWELAGVISFGFGHCGSRSPLVVTRIQDPSILDWIKEVITEDGEELPNRPTSRNAIAAEGPVW